MWTAAIGNDGAKADLSARNLLAVFPFMASDLSQLEGAKTASEAIQTFNALQTVQYHEVQLGPEVTGLGTLRAVKAACIQAIVTEVLT
jgi:hypothetical protein